MNTARLPSIRESFKTDLSAAVVVFLVAIPLCLGISLASGAPLTSGIVAGIVGGIVVSLISGSSLSVSGPAAGLATISLEAIHYLGSFERFLTAVVIAGLFQLLFGVLKLGVCGEYVPTSVVKGLLAGIGLVIFLKQIPHAIGYDKDYQGDLGFFQHLDKNNSFTAILRAIERPNMLAIGITVVSLIILFSYDKFFKGKRFALLFPPQLIVVVLGALAAAFIGDYSPELNLQKASGHFVDLPIIGSIAELRSLPFPDLSAITDRFIIQAALTIAIVASLESLLSLEATDKLDPYKRISPPNRELIAQGTGNIFSGLLGGLPITAVIVRSSTNIYAGAKTKASAFMHGVFLIFAILFIPYILNQIPLCALAAILLHVGYKLSNAKLYRQMYIAGQDQFLPFIATVLGILFTDLLVGVLIGLSIGLFYVLKLNHHNSVTLVQDGTDCLVRFNKDISFLNKMELKEVLSKIPDNTSVVIDGTKAMYIDRDIYDVLSDFERNCSHRGIKVSFRHTEGKMLPLFRKKINA